MEIKFKSQAVIALNKVTVHLQRAQKTLTSLGRSAIDKPRRLQEARRTSENDLRKLLENSLDAIVVASGKITAFGSQAFIALNKVTVHLQKSAENAHQAGKGCS